MEGVRVHPPGTGIGLENLASIKVGTSQVRASEVGVGEVSVGEAGASECRAYQANAHGRRRVRPLLDADDANALSAQGGECLVSAAVRADGTDCGDSATEPR